MKTEEINIDFENSLGPWLGKTEKVMRFHLQKLLLEKGIDLNKEQLIILKKLHDRDGLNQNELAFLTLRDKSSLTRLLTKMERKKYILRKKNPLDKRNNLVFLTEMGKTTFQKAKPEMKRILTKIEDGIPLNEKQIFISVLKKIQTNFGESSESL